MLEGPAGFLTNLAAGRGEIARIFLGVGTDNPFGADVSDGGQTPFDDPQRREIRSTMRNPSDPTGLRAPADQTTSPTISLSLDFQFADGTNLYDGQLAPRTRDAGEVFTAENAAELHALVQAGGGGLDTNAVDARITAGVKEYARTGQRKVAASDMQTKPEEVVNAFDGDAWSALGGVSSLRGTIYTASDVVAQDFQESRTQGPHLENNYVAIRIPVAQKDNLANLRLYIGENDGEDYHTIYPASGWTHLIDSVGNAYYVQQVSDHPAGDWFGVQGFTPLRLDDESAAASVDAALIAGTGITKTADDTSVTVATDPAGIVSGLEGLTGNARLQASAIRGLSQGGGGLQAVSSDTSLTGSGTDGDPLKVANPFTDADETKLDGIETGATADQTGDDIRNALENLSGASKLPGTALEDGSIETEQLADDAVTQAKIGPGAVGTTEIEDNAVTTAKIASQTILGSRMGSNSVGSRVIAAGAVIAGKIGPLAVQEGNIGNAAVTAGKINNGAVTEGKLGALAVTAAKIAGGAVSLAKAGADLVARLVPTGGTDKQVLTRSGATGYGWADAASGGGQTLAETLLDRTAVGVTFSDAGADRLGVPVYLPLTTYSLTDQTGVFFLDLEFAFSGSSITNFGFSSGTPGDATTSQDHNFTASALLASPVFVTGGDLEGVLHSQDVYSGSTKIGTVDWRTTRLANGQIGYYLSYDAGTGHSVTGGATVTVTATLSYLPTDAGSAATPDAPELEFTRIDGDSTVLTGTTRAVDISDYAALVFVCHETGGNSAVQRGRTTILIPKAEIDALTGADTAASGANTFDIFSWRHPSGTTGQCFLTIGKTVDERLRYNVTGGNWNIYGVEGGSGGGGGGGGTPSPPTTTRYATTSTPTLSSSSATVGTAITVGLNPLDGDHAAQGLTLASNRITVAREGEYSIAWSLNLQTDTNPAVGQGAGRSYIDHMLVHTPSGGSAAVVKSTRHTCYIRVPNNVTATNQSPLNMITSGGATLKLGAGDSIEVRLVPKLLQAPGTSVSVLSPDSEVRVVNSEVS